MEHENINNEMKHYDVGIFGVWSGCNYGSVATYYALNKIITSMGKTALMIDKPIISDEDVELKETHARRFGREHYNISKQYRLEQLHQLNNICDTFLIGSDQVWNYGISKNFGKAFYLDFVGENKKKIAYGVSFGHGIDFAPGDERKVIAEYMSYFDGIGTREADGVRICKECYGINAEHVIDPVFLADPEVYEPLIEKSAYKEEEPFIVAYILDPTPEKRDAILHLQKEFGGIKVINLLDGLPWLFEKNKELTNLPNCMENVQVEEWLYYLKNAKFVLTDSCHGASFALIFKRDFIAITNKRRGFSRFKSLSELFKFEDHVITNPRDVITNPELLKPINYSVVEDIMDSERRRCYKWLDDAINLPQKSEKELRDKNIIGEINPINKRLIPKPENGLCDERNVLSVVEKGNCSGCGACESLCLKGAIKLVKNTEGFLVPDLNRNKCINCGLCLKKCTSENSVYKNNIDPKCYAMMASDEIREISSSGGMFTIAAEYIIEQGGFVCGAAYNEDFTVEHIIINDKSDLGRLRGSKYMQSYASGIFSNIKELLQAGNTVLFTGMPCQVAGLYSYLGKEYDKLYTMDLLCHGITSSKVFEKYHRDVLEGKELKRLEFKEKEPWGWHAGVNAYFSDGTKYSKPLETDMYFIAYLKSIAKNTTCGKCVSNKLPRQGDLTIGDFWGIARYDEEVYDKKGTSVVLVNNQKAEEFFEVLKPRMLKVKEEPLSIAIKGNKIIQGPYRLHKNRDEFFRCFDELDFTSLTKGCYNNELYKYSKVALTKKLPEELHEYYYLAKTAAKKCKGRKIVTWTESKEFEQILRDCFNMEVAFSIAKSPSRVNNETIFPSSNIKMRSGELYIVALSPTNSLDTYKTFEEYGYREIEDFICRFPKAIVLNEYDLASGMYSDAYGNTIEGYAGKIGKVIFRGCNNHIIIGDKVVGTQNLTFDLTENSYIELEAENRFTAENLFMTRGRNGKSEVIIRKGCRLTDAIFRLYNSEFVSSIVINEDCTFESNLELHANSGKKIIIGRDCMFSHDVEMWAGDGHSIFDVETDENVNSVYEKQPQHRNEIVIGEHVWVAKGAFIMHGTNIGNGSIVGAKSVVKGLFPNNCIIGGNPAKMIKKNSAWSRDMVTEDIERCGKSEYYALTKMPDEKKGKRKVLILGGTGRMSSKLTSLCIENGDDVTIAVRGKHKVNNEIKSVKKIIFDRLDQNATKTLLEGKFYDVVFDCSAYVPQSVDWVLSSIKTNRYIYVSSFETYAHYHSGYNVNEEDLIVEDINYETNIRIGERAWYSRGKYNSELLIANKYSEVNYAIVRIPFVMSLEDDFEDELSSRVLKYVSAVMNEEPINGKNLERRFSFVESTDEARFLYLLSENNFKGVVNFASQGCISMKDVIQYVENKTGKCAIYSEEAKPFPFTVHPELTMDLSRCMQLDYIPMKLEDWLPDKMDIYIRLCEKRIKARQSKGNKIQNWMITGGDTEIGQALALKLHACGYNVAVTGYDVSVLQQLPKDILALELDARNVGDCEKALDIVIDKIGEVDVLVNVGDVFQEIMDDVIDYNYWIISNMVKLIIPHMRKNRNGTVVNILPNIGTDCHKVPMDYLATKFAISNLTKNLKFECQRFMRFMVVDAQAIRGIVNSDDQKDSKKNELDKLATNIIETLKENEIPRELLFGKDVYQKYVSELIKFEEEIKKYKSISITTDEAKQDSIKLEDIVIPRNNNMQIQNWLITGASEGFGKVLALRLNELGYTVTVTSRELSKLKSLPENINKIESQLDTAEECQHVIDAAINKMGSVDVLVNNATSNCWSSFEECPEEVMRKVFYVNYTLPQNLIKSVLPHMREHSNGTVINITSIAGIQPRARVSTYSAAKAALEGLTRTLKSECQQFARFMAVELVCMRTRIMINNPVIDTKISEYKKLGRYTHKINNIPNRKDITAQQIINVVNQEEIPQSLLIGTESYMIAKNEIERATKEYEEYKDVTLSICEKK